MVMDKNKLEQAVKIAKAKAEDLNKALVELARIDAKTKDADVLVSINSVRAQVGEDKVPAVQIKLGVKYTQAL